VYVIFITVPFGMCSKQVVSTSRRLAAERGFGDDSERQGEKTSYIYNNEDLQ
jgi:hypothetical protein